MGWPGRGPWLVAHPGRVVMVGCNLRFSEGYAALTANAAEAGRAVALLPDYGWWLPAWRPSTTTAASTAPALAGRRHRA